jgi:2,3-dihydroxybenzoate decarboxylase
MIKPYLAYPGLHTAMLGFSAEVSLHTLRLICSGVFDQFPQLTLILGHLGEALPYWLWRMDNMWQLRTFPHRPKRLPSEYFRDNFYITTSGMFWEPPLLCACMAVGADKILFAVDYPIELNQKAVQFIESASISQRDKEKICHRNAERLLGLSQKAGNR